MTEKIDATEESVDKDVAPSSSGNFDDSFKQLLYAQLVSGGEEAILERKQRRETGRWVAVVAGVVPVVALIMLFIGIFVRPKYFLGGMSSMVLIFASFSSMVVIYAFLIKGMFPGTQKMTRITHTPLLMRH